MSNFCVNISKRYKVSRQNWRSIPDKSIILAYCLQEQRKALGTIDLNILSAEITSIQDLCLLPNGLLDLYYLQVDVHFLYFFDSDRCGLC